jgi:hypothetical protein
VGFRFGILGLAFEYQITNTNFTTLSKIVKKYRIPNDCMSFQSVKQAIPRIPSIKDKKYN